MAQQSFEEDPDLVRWEKEYGWMDEEDTAPVTPAQTRRTRDRSYRKIDKKLDRKRARPKKVHFFEKPEPTETHASGPDLDPELAEFIEDITLDALQDVAVASDRKQKINGF